MIKFENTEVMGWKAAIRGMRNPMNSWEKSDSHEVTVSDYMTSVTPWDLKNSYIIGPNDLDLMKRLSAGGPVHAKYRRMITVYVDITAPLYWWKEFDTYKVGTVANSCSTMHKIHAKEFTLGDFSTEHLVNYSTSYSKPIITPETSCKDMLQMLIAVLNKARGMYLETKDKKYWWQMIQLLPSSYNQKRTVMLNYEVLSHIYQDRKDHKLDEWSENHINVDGVDMSPGEGTFGFCDWIKSLPYSELITREVLANE